MKINYIYNNYEDYKCEDYDDSMSFAEFQKMELTDFIADAVNKRTSEKINWTNAYQKLAEIAETIIIKGTKEPKIDLSFLYDYDISFIADDLDAYQFEEAVEEALRGFEMIMNGTYPRTEPSTKPIF